MLLGPAVCASHLPGLPCRAVSQVLGLTPFPTRIPKVPGGGQDREMAPSASVLLPGSCTDKNLPQVLCGERRRKGSLVERSTGAALEARAPALQGALPQGGFARNDGQMASLQTTLTLETMPNTRKIPPVIILPIQIKSETSNSQMVLQKKHE